MDDDDSFEPESESEEVSESEHRFRDGKNPPIHMCSFEGCSAKFSRPNRLQTHILSCHTKERPFKCEQCDRAYSRSQHLKRHVQNSHVQMKESAASSSPGNFECPNCNKKYANKDSLAKHMKKYRQKFVCEVCQKAFHKHHLLRSHMTEHTGKNNFPCTHCEKSFQFPSQLRIHVKRNHRKSRYRCSECSEHFDVFQDLRSHRSKRHSEPKEAKTCNVCDKTFPKASFLKDHAKSHAEQREVYHCTHEGCPRYYYFERNLKQHIRSYHEGKKIACTVPNCDQKFFNKNTMRRHVFDVHNQSVKPKKAKKPPRPRKDKGTAKKPIASVLTNVALAAEDSRGLLESEGNTLDVEAIEQEINADPKLKEDFLSPPSEVDAETALLCRRTKLDTVQAKEVDPSVGPVKMWEIPFANPVLEDPKIIEEPIPFGSDMFRMRTADPSDSESDVPTVEDSGPKECLPKKKAFDFSKYIIK